MSLPLSALERRLRVSSTLVLLGLAAETASLLWAHPTAFIFDIAAGGGLVLAGIAWYLLSLVS